MGIVEMQTAGSEQEGSGSSSPIWPPASEVQAEEIDAFVGAIDPDAVCALASQLSGGRQCRIFRDQESGSFNLCFFIELAPDVTASANIRAGLDTETGTSYSESCRWVVRIPIEPALHDSWAKLQSEVATMRYVEKNTSIPVPHVQHYGREAILGSQESPMQCCYLIVDYVDGEPLDLESFLSDTTDRQNHVYRQLIDVFAQLRQLEFDAAGSLMPDSSVPGSETSSVVLGTLQSASYNELQRLTRGRAKTRLASAYRSSAAFARGQFAVVQEDYNDMPMASATLANVRMESFALHDLGQRLETLLCPIGPQDSINTTQETFALAHTDLRWSNIIVDGASLNVRAIIDWEWAAVVPVSRLGFFLPPLWLAGPSPCYVASLAYEKAYGQFHRLLEATAAEADLQGQGLTDRECHRHNQTNALLPAASYHALLGTWGPDLPRRVELPLAVILQQPYHLVPAYYFSIFPMFYKITPDNMPPQQVARLLAMDACEAASSLDSDSKEKHGVLTRSVCRRMAAADAYRRHLDACGLLVDYELAPDALAWLRAQDAKRARRLETLLQRYASEGRAPTDEVARVLLESVLQASIQPRNFEPVLGNELRRLESSIEDGILI